MLAQFVLFDGFDPLDVIGPFEVFSAAEQFTDLVSVVLVAADGPGVVRSGIPAVSLTATAGLAPDRADLIVVPGAAGRMAHQGGDLTEEEREATIPAILARSLTTGLPGLLAKALATSGTTVATVCGGSLVLSMAGLIVGRNAVTHHQGLDVLGAGGVNVVRARVVDDGDLVTAGGVTSGLDLGLYLLEREVGPKVALAVEELFAHERRGVVWREHGPAPVHA
ncbi:DJ-1/PfpI family protein [Actinomadura rupiterrae]|uniref:DJ-1/PfpI family protein n=1 Tax=Actinomadura rupiterrae TaxID=559627 RepID=UPI0020A491A3|nr:DJ-1/PfpI family protein [Actinomadura rupiterrae]MCP2342127.1 transcriptional regulator GlxA family with amidase domain [Actinomadura rupiterrae]